jgi:hypothetical protein
MSNIVHGLYGHYDWRDSDLLKHVGGTCSALVDSVTSAERSLVICNLEICELWLKEVKFLGLLSLAQGISVDSSEVSAIS